MVIADAAPHDLRLAVAAAAPRRREEPAGQ